METESLALCLHPDFLIELDMRSVLGSASKLRDVFKVSQLIAWKLDSLLESRAVYPSVYQVSLSASKAGAGVG